MDETRAISIDHAAMLDKMSQAKAQWKRQTFQESLPSDISAFRALLENYSKIPSEEVEQHLYGIRNKAWEVAQYPCIGGFSFTRLSQFKDPEMGVAIARLTAPGSTHTLLDLGCCLGQTLRQLVMSGADPRRLFGSDLYPAFFGIGHELFRDEGCGITFVAGNMLGDDAKADASLAPLDGRISIIHASHFFHLFSRPQQLIIGRRIAGRFLQPQRSDAVVFGRQIGTVKSGETPRPMDMPGSKFLHDQASLQELWDEIGRDTGTAWTVELTVLAPLPREIPSFDEDARVVRYAVWQKPVE